MLDDDERKYAADGPGMDVSVTSSSLSPYTLNYDKLNLQSAAASSGNDDDYVFSEHKAQEAEHAWGRTLTSGTGITYLSGLAVGGTWGLVEGFRRPDGKTFNLRLNSVLNACGRRGPLVGNRLAIIALMYTFADGGIAKITNDGSPNTASKVTAGALTGALFRSTAGPKRAGIAAGIGAGLACVGVAASSVVSSFMREEGEYL